jgi:hypothetical protein
MTVVVREGVYEMLEFLEPFCNFYVYSHGLKDYVLKLLEVVDPYQRFIVQRSQRVLAPVDCHEQADFAKRGKGFLDFKNPMDPCRPLFSDQERQRCVIIDD